MTDNGVPRDIAGEVHTIAERLAHACEAVGLSTEVLTPERVRVCMSDTHAGLAETITIAPDENEVLSLFWSWGERICPAGEINRAAAAIKHVVTPPLGSAL